MEACIFKNQSACDKYYSKRKVEGVFVLSDLNNLVPYSYHVKSKQISENELITSRFNGEFISTGYVCAKHRYVFGVDWRPQKQCMHPNHILAGKI